MKKPAVTSTPVGAGAVGTLGASPVAATDLVLGTSHMALPADSSASVAGSSARTPRHKKSKQELREIYTPSGKKSVASTSSVLEAQIDRDKLSADPPKTLRNGRIIGKR